MRFSFLSVCFFACAAPLFAQTSPPVAVPSLFALQQDVTRVVARAQPSVVTIVCEKPRSAAKDKSEKPPSVDPLRPVTGLGTGWIFRADGFILTNYHVVRSATSIHVSFAPDNNSHDLERGLGIPARVVGYDPDSDLAVLKINRANLPTLELGDSDAVQVGQWTLAVGAPFLQPKSVTLGVLSGRGRDIEDDEDEDSHQPYLYLQTDAALNPGNSGGPLLDLNGRVIGVNTEIWTTSEANAGAGFSLPSNTIRVLLPQLMAGKRVKRAILGASLSVLAPDAAREFGLDGGVVVGLLAQKKDADAGPAKDADVRRGDIIIAVEGKPLATPDEFRALLLAHSPGDTVHLDIARPDFAGDGNIQKTTVSLVLGDSALVESDTAPAFSLAPDAAIAGSGLSVADAKTLDAAHKDRYALDGTESGAVITAIAPLSRADEAGLTAGFRIVRARQNGKWTNISSAADWKTLESSAAPESHLLLEVHDYDETDEFRVLVLPAA